MPGSPLSASSFFALEPYRCMALTKRLKAGSVAASTFQYPAVSYAYATANGVSSTPSQNTNDKNLRCHVGCFHGCTQAIFPSPTADQLPGRAAAPQANSLFPQGRATRRPLSRPRISHKGHPQIPSPDLPSCHALPLILGLVKDLEAGKLDWVGSLPSAPPARDGLARIVDADGGRDDAENSYYEAAADPSFVQMEAARRRFRGQYLRRLKRRAERARSSGI